MALPTPPPAPGGALSLSSCLLGHLPELCTQQPLNACLQADLTLCSVQQISPGYKDPRGRNGQAAARPTQDGWALGSGGSVSLVQPWLTWPDPGHLQLAVCLLSRPHKLLSSWSSLEVSISPLPLCLPASQGSMPPAGPSCRPRVSFL